MDLGFNPDQVWNIKLTALAKGQIYPSCPRSQRALDMYQRIWWK
jgi:hypothetical protein